MKPGTIVKLPDGRVGTVVYNGLDGQGIRWGALTLTEGEKAALLNCTAGDEWEPHALLREPYKGADWDCVGGEYEVIERP